jgi:hypothetical protein
LICFFTISSVTALDAAQKQPLPINAVLMHQAKNMILELQILYGSQVAEVGIFCPPKGSFRLLPTRAGIARFSRHHFICLVYSAMFVIDS